MSSSLRLTDVLGSAEWVKSVGKGVSSGTLQVLSSPEFSSQGWEAHACIGCRGSQQGFTGIVRNTSGPDGAVSFQRFPVSTQGLWPPSDIKNSEETEAECEGLMFWGREKCRRQRGGKARLRKCGYTSFYLENLIFVLLFILFINLYFIL